MYEDLKENKEAWAKVQAQIKARIDASFTVADVIKILQKLPQDALVGTVGHFGEFYPLDSEHDITHRDAYLTPDGYWNGEPREKVSVVDIELPDIGPAPN